MSDNDPKVVERVKKRYFRKVINVPEGRIVHDGDCRFWDVKICTCGLLHALIWLSDPFEVYPDFGKENGEQECVINKLKFGDE
jgi:hypothetical protein